MTTPAQQGIEAARAEMHFRPITDELDPVRALNLAYVMLVKIGNGGSYTIAEFYDKLRAIESAIQKAE